MEDVFAVIPTGFGKSLIFQLFPQVISLMNGKANAVTTIVMVCLALVAILRDQVEQLNKIGVAAMAIRIGKEAVRNRKV